MIIILFAAAAVIFFCLTLLCLNYDLDVLGSILEFLCGTSVVAAVILSIIVIFTKVEDMTILDSYNQTKMWYENCLTNQNLSPEERNNILRECKDFNMSIAKSKKFSDDIIIGCLYYKNLKNAEPLDFTKIPPANSAFTANINKK